jgi:hypothetical protein
MVAGMSKPDTPENKPQAAPKQRATLGQQDLIALALAEKLRRRQARSTLGVGAWAAVVDPALADQIGEDIVRVTEIRGSSRTVAAFFNGSSTIVPSDKLKPTLASGDVMAKAGHKYVVLDLYPRRTGHDHELAWGMSPQWGIHGAGNDEPHVVELDVRDVAAEVEADSHTSVVSAREFTDHAAYVVRGAVGHSPSPESRLPPTIGPDLSVPDFSHVASCAEPCRVRKDAAGRIIDDHVAGRRAILCDFLGGATLWIWAEVLVQCPHTVQWNDSPSAGRHPETAKILAPSEHVLPDAVKTPPTDAPTLPASTATAALPASPVTDPAPTSALGAGLYTPPPLELDMNTNAKIIHNITSSPRLARGTIVIVDEGYRERVEEAVGALRTRFSETDLESTDALEDIETIHNETGDAILGAYEVRRSDDVELPDGSTFAKITCVPAGGSSHDRHDFFAALVRVAAGGALALPASTDGAVARVAKSVGGKALDVAKDAFVGVKDMAVDEGKRKALAFAQVASQDTLVAGHEAVRRTVLAAGAGFMGADNPQAAATNAALAQGFDMLSIGAGKLLARALAKHAPGTAQVIDAATASLQQGIDRKQAHGVLDQVMPVVGGGLKALAQAAVTRMMPALPAAPTAALPAPAADAPPPAEAPAKPKRKRAPKATPSQTGGAK